MIYKFHATVLDIRDDHMVTSSFIGVGRPQKIESCYKFLVVATVTAVAVYNYFSRHLRCYCHQRVFIKL